MISTQVKGMMIDEAIVQLRYVNKKAADIVREVSKLRLSFPAVVCTVYFCKCRSITKAYM